VHLRELGTFIDITIPTAAAFIYIPFSARVLDAWRGVIPKAVHLLHTEPFVETLL